MIGRLGIVRTAPMGGGGGHIRPFAPTIRYWGILAHSTTTLAR